MWFLSYVYRPYKHAWSFRSVVTEIDPFEYMVLMDHVTNKGKRKKRENELLFFKEMTEEEVKLWQTSKENKNK